MPQIRAPYLTGMNSVREVFMLLYFINHAHRDYPPPKVNTAMAGPSHAAMANADEDERIFFCVGERFKSYQQLEVKIQQYEQQHFVKLWKRDCRDY